MKRDLRIDFLRVLAIMLILLAHVSPPALLFSLRVFDVPLMAMLLGMSYFLSENKSEKIVYPTYIIKRFKRLIWPAWQFITIYFGFIFLESLFHNQSFPYSVSYLFNSYKLLFLGGMEYVWIIGVFFVIAVISPVLKFIADLTNNILLRILIILPLLCLQDMICTLSYSNNGNKVIQQLGIYTGYSLIALIGIWVIQQNWQQNLLFSFLFIFLFEIYCMKEGFLSIQAAKYPPGVFFISYGLGIGILLFVILSNQFFISKMDSLFVRWVSANTLHIYYWHIIGLFFLKDSIEEINWILKYAIILSFSLIGTLIQKEIIRFLNLKKARN